VQSLVYLLYTDRPLRQAFLTKLVDVLGIAPSSSALQADADLSQLNVQKGEAERTRTVIVFIDNEVHTPFCHGLEKIVVSSRWSVVRNPKHEFSDHCRPATGHCFLRLFSCQTSKKGAATTGFSMKPV
jgi:hypothetical protein